MGVDHDAVLVIGCFVESFLPLTRKVEKKTHKEKRFDPKTGKRVADAEVVDREEGLIHVFEGEEYEPDDPYGYMPANDLIVDIAEKLKCSFVMTYEYEEVKVFFTAKKTCAQYSSAPLSIPQREKTQLARIYKELKALKLDVGKPCIHAVPQAD